MEAIIAEFREPLNSSHEFGTGIGNTLINPELHSGRFLFRGFKQICQYGGIPAEQVLRKAKTMCESNSKRFVS